LAIIYGFLLARGVGNAVSRWYYWVCGFFLLDTMQAFGFMSRMVYGSWVAKPGDLITQTLNLLMFAASLTLFGDSYRRRVSGLATGSGLVFLAAGLLCLSALWSLSPATTLREGVVYLFVVIGVIGVARTLDAEEYMHLLSWCCFLSAAVSLFLLIASPHNALMGPDFIGVFSHKNFLGQVMATGALATLHGIRVARGRHLGKLCMLFVFVGMAFASKSTTALLATLLFCGISGIDSLWRRGGAARVTGLVLALFFVPAIIVTVAAPDTFLELIGKDPTLTGRTEIWAYVIQDIRMKPWLGWGYFGFWSMSNPAVVEMSDAVHYVVPEAHNGLLEILLNVGVLGTALFAFILIRTIVLAVRCFRTPDRALAVSTISCCLGILLQGVSETVLMQATQPFTPLMFITGLMCERALWAAKRQRYHVRDRQGQSGRLILPGPKGPLHVANISAYTGPGRN
jgi:exopolysaccharide production protein ExoQ